MSFAVDRSRARRTRYVDNLALAVLHLDRACTSLSRAYSAADGQHAEMGTQDLSRRAIALRNDVSSLLGIVRAQQANADEVSDEVSA